MVQSQVVHVMKLNDSFTEDNLTFLGQLSVVRYSVISLPFTSKILLMHFGLSEWAPFWGI